MRDLSFIKKPYSNVESEPKFIMDRLQCLLGLPYENGFRFTLKAIKDLINIDSYCPESGSSFDSGVEFKNEPINCSACEKQANWYCFLYGESAWSIH